MIAVVAANDAFVMSGWARVEGVKDKVCVRFFLDSMRFCTCMRFLSLVHALRSCVHSLLHAFFAAFMHLFFPYSFIRHEPTHCLLTLPHLSNHPHQILALSDTNAEWSAKLGLDVDLSAVGFGTRTSRYGLIIDDLVVKYVEQEQGKDVTVSGADALLAAL